jgi:membrane-bound lytic murein transglycosylase A
LLRYWAKNPHFVFFKETPLRGSGKFGQLVPGRSVAIDATEVPLGAALWMHTEMATAMATAPATAADAAPAGSPAADPPSSAAASVRYTPIDRLALAQDTGAAIRGRGRVDVFVGSGAAAHVAAALTSRPGELYLVIKKQRAPAHPPHTKKPAALRPHHHRRQRGKTATMDRKTN